MEKNMVSAYEAPAVEIIEVEVEKGFAMSSSEIGNAPVFGNGEDFASQINDIFEQIWGE